MRRHCLLALTVALFTLGCGGGTPKTSLKLDIADSGSPDKDPDKGKGGGIEINIDPDPGTTKPVEVEAKLPEQEAYDAAMMKAVDHLAEGRRKEAIDALEEAQKIKDTGPVQREIDKVRAALAQEAAAIKAVEDVKTVLDDGKADDAAKLAGQALSQHGGGDQSAELTRLKQQADAILTAGVDDADTRITRLRAEADEAEKQKNLRAASVALEQATALKPNEALTTRLDDIRDKLKTYDENRQRAAEIRKDPARLDDALTSLVAAKAAWNTTEVTQQIDEVTLVLERRRDRLSVADFEVRGDVGVAGIGRTVGEELLGYFKPRYDLVERSQLTKVLDELKLEASDLTDSQEGGRAVARLAKVRYLVVGSITPLAGITVQARLVEVSTGLVVQTARVSAPDLESLLPKLKQAAILLQMNDEQKAAYEDRLQSAVTVAVKPILATELVDLPPPPPVTELAVALPPPILTYTPARPALGNLLIEDYRALPALVLVQPPPPPALAFALTRTDPRRHRLFRLSLELGDNLFRRRQYVEANRHFGLALTLGGPRRELSLRLDSCQQYLPPPPVYYTPVVPVIGFPDLRPPVVIVQPILRPRVAVFGFNIYCPAALVPPSSSELLADQFASYCGGSYDVIDRGEVCWYMGRLGFTMRDLLNDPVSRRCLAQSLNARYLIFGTVTPTASFNVETHLFDATTGARTATGQIHVQDQAEMKLRMGELAQQIGAKPADRAAMVKSAESTEKAITEARKLTKTDPAKAAAVVSAALKAQPNNVALQNNVALRTILAEAQRNQKLADFEAARIKSAADNAATLEAGKKRQAELTKQADLAKVRAATEAKSRDEAGRKAQQDQKIAAAAKLREQATAASKSGDSARAAQLLQSSASLAPSRVTFEELAQAQQKAGETKKANDLAAQKSREKAAAASRESSQARILKEKQARDKADTDRRKAQDAKDKTAHDAYVKQANDFVAKKDFTQALAAADTAQRLQPSAAGAKLVSDSRYQLALVEAEKKGAGEKAKVEKERKDREAADAKLKANREAYNAAVKKGQDAIVARKYDEAIASYSAAAKLFPTDAALTGRKTATELQVSEKKAAADAARAREEAAKRTGRLKELVGQGNAALGTKEYARALGLFQEAKKIAPDNVDAITGLGQAQRERDAELVRMRRDTNAKTLVTKQMAAGKAALAKKQFADAATAFRAVLASDATNSEAKTLLAQAVAGSPKPRDDDYKLAMSAGLGAYKKGNWLGAINSYTEALRLRPGDGDATAGLNQARLGQKQADYTSWMAKAQTNVGAKKWADAIAAYDEALKAKPGDKVATDGRKDALARSKETTPDPTMLAREAAYKKAITAGLVAFKAKRWAEAIAAYDEALKSKPGDVTATKSRAAAVKARTDETPNPQPDAAYQAAMARADVATRAKKWADAIKAYDEALKLKPGDATALQGKRTATAESTKPVPVPVDPKVKTMEETFKAALTAAQVASAKKQWAEAVKSYDAALKAKPGDPGATAGRAAALAAQKKEVYAAWMQRGQAMMAAKKYADAITAYDMALKVEPGDAVAIKGKRDATEANKPAPKTPPPPPPANPLAEYTKAMQSGAQAETAKKWADAATAYSTAAKWMPGDFTKDAALKTRQGSAYAGLARAEHAQARYAEAIKAYEEVLKRNPADANAKAGMARAKANKP